jgi:hypothetical protein
MVKKQSEAEKRSSKGRTFPQSVRLGIFGASGSGKSYRARQLTEGLERVLFFDPLGDFSNGATVICDYDKLINFLFHNWRLGFRISYRPEFGNEVEELHKISNMLLLLQYGYGRQHWGKLTLVVDELDEGFPSGITQKNPKNGFAYLCKRGRHFGINLIGCSQRTAQVDVCFRGNLTGLYLFRHVDPIDTEKALQMLGRQYAADFRNLNDREYIYKSGALQKIVKNEKK